MVIGIGCDIIEIERVKKACENDSFIKKVFTEREISYCNMRNSQAYSSYAARFAAKEAVLKAFGTGLRNGEIKEIEIINDDLGKPMVVLSGYHKALADEKGVANIHISLSHCKTQAIAYCIMED